MIDPNSHDCEVWYQANQACARQCEDWRKEIAEQRASRVLIDGAQRKGLWYQTKAQLRELLKDRGPKVRTFARSATKAALVDWIVQSRLAAVDATIARLEQQLQENQPDPRWREREADRQREEGWNGNAAKEKKIPTDRHVTYTQQYRRCGNPTCRCRSGNRHGPYWYAYWYVDGKLKGTYIGKELPEGALRNQEATARTRRNNDENE